MLRKHISLCLFLLIAVFSAVAQPAPRVDLTTTDGVVYKHVRVLENASDLLIVLTESGAITIQKDSLDETSRVKVGFDKAAADAERARKNNAAALAAQIAQESALREAREAREQAEKRAAAAEKAKEEADQKSAAIASAYLSLASAKSTKPDRASSPFDASALESIQTPASSMERPAANPPFLYHLKHSDGRVMSLAARYDFVGVITHSSRRSITVPYASVLDGGFDGMRVVNESSRGIYVGIAKDGDPDFPYFADIFIQGYVGTTSEFVRVSRVRRTVSGDVYMLAINDDAEQFQILVIGRGKGYVHQP